MVDLEAAGRRLSLARPAPTPPVVRLEAMRARRAKHRRVTLVSSICAVLAVAVGVAAASWAGSGAPRTTGVSTAPAALDPNSAALDVKLAVAATEAAGSARFDDVATSSDPADDLQSVGSVNFASRQLELATGNSLTGPSARATQIRIIGQAEYATSVAPELSGVGTLQWTKTTVARPLGIFDWLFVPLSARHLTASYLGPANIAGAETYEYAVAIPSTAVGGAGVAPYEIRVWLDGQGRVRQATTTRPGGGPTGTPAAGPLTQTIRFSDFGLPVAVTAPGPVTAMP